MNFLVFFCLVNFQCELCKKPSPPCPCRPLLKSPPLFLHTHSNTWLCPTLHHPMDYSLSGSSTHGILQARILEWVAISFSRGSSRPRDRTQVSSIAGRFFTLSHQGSPPTLFWNICLPNLCYTTCTSRVGTRPFNNWLKELVFVAHQLYDHRQIV